VQLTEKAEETLELLWVELVERKKAHVDASRLDDSSVLEELAGFDLVDVRETLLSLTPDGRREAEGCVRRHRLAERLFVDVLDLKGPLVHETSCTFEHLLHRGLDNSVCTLLGHPRTCPHGQPIPEGSCCREARQHLGRLIFPLPELDKDQQGVVAYLHTHDRDALQKLIAMGILPKSRITLIQRFPTLVLQAGNSQFAIDEELASNIFVRTTTES
jgi:DtxR family Mn-dependent transcriptional regulator